MPDVAADSDEGVLAAWLVEESARFDAAQTIAYVETADELFSVEAGRPGVLLKTLVEPGSRVEPGTPIGILGEPWEQVHDLDAVLAELGLSSPGRARVGARAAMLEAPVAGHRAAAPELSIVPEVTAVVAPVEEGARASVVEEGARASVVEEGALAPVTRPGEARDHLTTRPDPGAQASVVEEGALAPVTRPGEARDHLTTRPDPATDPGAQVISHHYLRARVRVDRLVSLSARLERDRPESSVVDLVGRAVIAAHRQVPQLGVARIEDDHAATAGIPVTYPGRFGVEEAAAVVPAGQAAVLAVGDVRDEPVLDAGAVVPGKVMTVTLSIRPGRVDDVVASRWLAVLSALLERPEWLAD
jgi:pyruvate dehydrogenase E2 component (dihydrolipoamide acetyltransferase)